MRILGLIYDPLYQGNRIHVLKNWTHPLTGLNKAVDDLNSIIPPDSQYTIDIKHLDRLGVSTRGFGVDKLNEIDWGTPYYYSPEEWLTNWNTLGFNTSKWPHGGDVHVKDFIEHNNLVNLINSGIYDEVWLAGLPIPAAFEGCMVVPEGDTGAYPTHDRVVYVPGLNRRFVWHMFQVGNWNPIHNYWHRVEAIMSRIWGRSTMGYCEQNSNLTAMENIQNPWQLFTMTENCRPGEAQIGSCHFAPNSKLGYVHNMEDDVPSGAHLWLDYPNGFPLNLDREDRWQIVNYDTWKDLPEYIWQLSHIPKADGVYDGRDNNWWNYITNVNYQRGRNLPTQMPWTGTPRSLPNAMTRYNNQVVLRWQASDLDTNETEYEIHIDGKLHKKLKRRGRDHVNLSAAVADGAKYEIINPGVWTLPINGETPPIIREEKSMYTIAEFWLIINAAHAPGGILASNPKPTQIIDQGSTYLVKWDDHDMSMAMTSQISSTIAATLYIMAYPAALKLITVSPPPIVVPPVIIPAQDDLRTFIQAHIAALEAYINVFKSKL